VLALCPKYRVKVVALLLLCDTLRDHDNHAWPVLERLSSARVAVRSLIASFVLEHVLERNFAFHFAHIEDIVRRGNLKILQVLDGCYRLGEAEKHQAEIDNLLLAHGIKPKCGSAKSDAETPAGEES